MYGNEPISQLFPPTPTCNRASHPLDLLYPIIPPCASMYTMPFSPLPHPTSSPKFPSPGTPFPLLQGLLLHAPLSTWLILPVAPVLNCCVVHFPVTRALVTGLLIGFHADRWALPKEPSKSLAVWADCCLLGCRIALETTLHATFAVDGNKWRQPER